jgi:hypothetical protein
MTVEECRAASKSTHQNFGYFLSMSQQAFSADIIPISAVRLFSQETEGTKTKAARVLIRWLARKFRSLYCAHLATLKSKPQRQNQKQQKSPAGTRKTEGKNLVWFGFGEIERKLAKLLMTTFTYRSSV